MAKRKIKIPEGTRQRVTDFAGKMWLTLRLPLDFNQRVGPLKANELGCVDYERNYIMFRSINDDTDIITIIHELAHIAFPNATEDDIQRGDSIFKDALESYGVDLMPLLKGYRKP
ncbi:MAG: hypothetical protein OEV86_13020 [Candidatus Krumholzibacteria bacterium]|nr:hypothetical protein [Candidatus Krumholzibacteria bacterium]